MSSVFYKVLKFINYSVRRATTGSFFAALLEGIIPAKSVKIMLMQTKAIAIVGGKIALRLVIPVRCCKIIFIGMHNRYVTRTPKAPEEKPIITVSALNMLETLRFEAPIARKIPISFVLS